MSLAEGTAAPIRTAPRTGNVAKIRVQRELERRIRERPGLRVLDVGLVGPSPFDLWEPLFDSGEFRLTGVDVAGLDRARRMAEARGWEVELIEGTGYELERILGARCFDVVVATQVLEHVARLPRFLSQVSRVLIPGGEALFTFDSAHWRPRWSPRWPGRLAKNVVKKLLAMAGSERYYDLPWTAEEVAAVCRDSGLEVVAVAYHNLPAVKRIHNHLTPADSKDLLMERWYTLEEEINRNPQVAQRARDQFAGVFLHGRCRRQAS